MPNVTFFGMLFTVWGAITLALAMLLVYRATISMKEEDLLFLDPAEAGFAEHQVQIQSQLTHLRPYVLGLAALSAGLFVLMVAYVAFAVLAAL